MARAHPLRSARQRADAVGDAFLDLLDQEFGATVGHLTTLLHGCAFAPSLLTFWLVNGVLDFSTAFAIGAIAGPGGLVVRLAAYLLLVPVFIGLRAAFYLVHPRHRQTILSGACPSSQVLSLDWFSVGILATGLPLALQDLGPWLGMNAIFLLDLFVLPRAVSAGSRPKLKLGAIALGLAVFGYAKYGGLLAGLLPLLPAPGAVLGPVATFTLTDATTDRLLGVMNSLLTGPAVVAALAVGMNGLLTHPAVAEVPVVRHTLPHRDPPGLVVTSAALGTVFYLLVVAAATGRLVWLP